MSTDAVDGDNEDSDDESLRETEQGEDASETDEDEDLEELNIPWCGLQNRFSRRCYSVCYIPIFCKMNTFLDLKRVIFKKIMLYLVTLYFFA